VPGDHNNLDIREVSRPVRRELFISYSRKDSTWLEELRIHLTPLEVHDGLILWDDSIIQPGDNWLKEIEDALSRAAVALLLVSPDFLASNFIRRKELPALFQAAKDEGLTILWIPLRPCLWQSHPQLELRQAIFSPGRTLAEMDKIEQQKVMVKIAEQIQGKLKRVSVGNIGVWQEEPSGKPNRLIGPDNDDPPDTANAERIHREKGISLWPGKNIGLFVRIIKTINEKQISLATLAMLLLGPPCTFLLVQLIPSAWDNLSCNNSIGDSISEGEEVFMPTSDSNTVNAIDAGQLAIKCDPSRILDIYKTEWIKNKNSIAELPEQLIYINNAILESKYKPSEYYTIAVAISVPRAGNSDEQDYNKDFSKEILRGVAQLQTKINLGFLESNGDSRLGAIIDSSRKRPNNFLIEKGINNMGLKVIVVNDANNIVAATRVAKNITKKSEVLGLIGHYASAISIKTVDIYKEAKLAMISPGSTTPELTEIPRSNFFRTVYSGTEQAKLIAEFFKEESINNVASFYSDYDPFFSTPFNHQFKAKYRELNGKLIDVDYQHLLGKLDDKYIDQIIDNFNSGFSIKNSDKKSSQVDKLGVLFIPSPLGEAIVNTSQLMRIINADKIVGTWGLRRNKIAKDLGDLPSDRLGKIVFAVPWDRWSDFGQHSQDFLKDAVYLWGTQFLQPVTATAYDATKVLVHALEKKKGLTRDDGSNIIDILSDEEFKVEDGVTGPIQFIHPTGDRRIPGIPQAPAITFVHLLKCKQSFYPQFFPVEMTEAKC
jgi:ABC-type branched-subunit amino acid transport system substrate-binding protein